MIVTVIGKLLVLQHHIINGNLREVAQLTAELQDLPWLVGMDVHLRHMFITHHDQGIPLGIKFFANSFWVNTIS